MPDVGMNLTSVNYWTTQAPFLDRFKTSGTWSARTADYQNVSAPVPLDANGYPTGMPAGASAISVCFNMDPLVSGVPNRYVLTYSGTASLDIYGGNIVSSEPGKLVFDFVNTNIDFAILTVSGMDPNNPVNNIHVVREDQVPLYQAGQIFNPAFLQKADNWNTLRFMDWESTNASNSFNWSQRTTPNSASWADQVSTSGVPLEVMVALANQTHTDMWFNIPTKADDDYVRQSLTYIRDHLDPSLKVKVEYSNEVWNWGFDAAAYAHAQGAQLWGDNAANWLIYDGYRSAQVAYIAKSVFGTDANARLETILATQTAAVGVESYFVTGVARAGLGSIGQLFNDFAVTTYFGGAFDAATNNAGDIATLLGWARSGASGLTAAFHELEFGGTLSNNDSLSGLVGLLQYQAAFAKANGMNLVAYEGGAHLTASFFPTDDQPDIVDFISRLMNDPRMGTLYNKMVSEFTAAGGTELTAFADTGSLGPSGYWGILDNVYQTSSPRYDALSGAAAATSGQALAAAIQTTTTTNAATFQFSSWVGAAVKTASMTGGSMAAGLSDRVLATDVDLGVTDPVASPPAIATAAGNDASDAVPGVPVETAAVAQVVSNGLTDTRDTVPIGADIEASSSSMPLSTTAAAASLVNAIVSTPATAAMSSSSASSSRTAAGILAATMSSQSNGALAAKRQMLLQVQDFAL